MKPDQKIRVLHIMSASELAGTERALLLLVGNSGDMGNSLGTRSEIKEQISVMSPEFPVPREFHFTHVAVVPGPGPLVDELRRRGVAAHIIERGAFSPAYHLKLAALICRLRPHIVHIHASRIAALPARLCGARVVERKNLTRDPEHRALSSHPALDRLANSLVQLTITPSEFLRQYYIERKLAAPDRIVTIYNGLDLAPFDAETDCAAVKKEFGFDPETPVVCAVGRIVPLKGLDDLLQAWPVVLKQRPEARLLLIGDGPQRPELEKKARDLNIDNTVIFAGRRNDVPRLLRCAAALVHPSHTEALSNAILEAMAARCPVAASDIPGNAEVVTHDKTGILFPARNPAAAAAAILQLLNNPVLAQSLAKNARRLIEEKFDNSVMAMKTQEVYMRLIGKGIPNLFTEPRAR